MEHLFEALPVATGTCPAKSLSNLGSFEIVRISTGSVTTTMSVIPGKYVRFIPSVPDSLPFSTQGRGYRSRRALSLRKANRIVCDTRPATEALGSEGVSVKRLL